MQKKYALFKKFPKIYYSFFFQKEIIGYTYICTKCSNNFKFTRRSSLLRECPQKPVYFL